jgi:Protein of unknown function (DUF3800)
MRVVYSDESGTGDIKQQVTVVTAIMLNADKQWESIEHELSTTKIYRVPVGLMNRGKGEIRLSTLFQNPELKGDRMFKGLRGKIRYVEPQSAVKALTQVLSIVVKHGVQIFHGAIDRAGYTEWLRMPEHFELSKEISDQSAAFLECLTRVDEFVRIRLPKEHVLWIADKSGFEKSVKGSLKRLQMLRKMNVGAALALLLKGAAQKSTDPKLQELIRIKREAVSKMKREAESRLNDPEQRRLYDPQQRWPLPVIDTIYFGESHESLALQLADVCCTTITQHLLGRDDAEPFYNLIRSQVITDGNLVKYSNAWKEKLREDPFLGRRPG